MSTTSSQFAQSDKIAHSQNCIEHLLPQITKIGNNRSSTDLAQDCFNPHRNDNFKGSDGIILGNNDFDVQSVSLERLVIRRVPNLILPFVYDI